MITGMWGTLELICGNKHDEPQKMYIRKTEDDVFYCCPKYLPENRDEFERPCMNHLSVAEVEKLTDLISEEIQRQEEENGAAFIKNRRFHTRIADYRVLESTDEKLVVEALLKTAKGGD